MSLKERKRVRFVDIIDIIDKGDAYVIEISDRNFYGFSNRTIDGIIADPSVKRLLDSAFESLEDAKIEAQSVFPNAKISVRG